MSQKPYRLSLTLPLLACSIVLLLLARAGYAGASAVWVTASTAADMPVVDLNGDLAGIDYATTFSEDEGPKAIVSVDGLTINNGDDTMLTAARAALAQHPDGALESLTVDPATVGGLKVEYKAQTGELTIQGAGTVTRYQTVLRSLTYNNLSQSPDITDRIVAVTVSDGALTSTPALSTVAINSVNDAPVLDNTGDMALAAIYEDDVNSSGNSVKKIIESAETGGQNRITDVDLNPLEGMAVIEAGSANGVWQYSLNAGASWQPFPAVSNTAAVLLNEAARIRFVPVAGYNGSAGFSFRAWDQSARANGDVGVDVSLNGGASAFSAQSESVTIEVLAVNDLPIIDLNGPVEGVNFETQFFEAGPPVPLAAADATLRDADHATLTTLTVTLLNHPDGAAEYLSANTAGTNITAAPYEPSKGLLVLDGPDTVANFEQVLRQITYHNTSGSPRAAARTVQFVASDGVETGAPATTVIKINPVNSAPVLTLAAPLSLAAVAEDATQSAGESVAQLLAKGGDPISDADPDALEGIAVIAADNSRGVWQYSTISPPTEASWQPVGVVADTAALLLANTDWLRFVPAANTSGPGGQLTFRAWDLTTGGNGQRDVDVTVNGANTAFSVATGVMTVDVTPVNDAPTLGNMPGAPAIYVEDAAAIALMPGVTLADIDSSQLASAEIVITNPLDGDAEWLLVTTGGTGIEAAFEDGVLRLSGAATPAVYQVVLRSVRYQNASQDPSAGQRLLQVTVADALAGSQPASLSVQVQPVNDAPELDLDSVTIGGDYEAVFYIGRGPASIVGAGLSITDIDDTTLKAATVRIANAVDRPAEFLDASLDGTSNIKRSYDPATGELRLTGVASVADYQRVLRTVTYHNILPQPNAAERIVEFVVSDAAVAGATRASHVRLLPAPTVYFFLPAVAGRVDEPNDECAQALNVPLNRDQMFYADDKNDWFYFDLPAAANVTVELRDFAPGKGQLLVAAGGACGGLQLIGNNGDNRPDKTVSLGARPAGRYHIWVITDGTLNTTDPYRLLVRTTP